MKRLTWTVLVGALVLACQTNAQSPGAPVEKKSAPVEKKAPVPVPGRAADVTAEDYVGPALPKARVTFTDAYGYKHAVDAEVAATREARTRGLMWRTQLPEGTGMLFIFPEEQELNFWMKNTLIPLDMVFVAKDLTIVGIVERAEPRTLSSRGPGIPATYVVEVPGGWASKIGLRPGLKVKLDGTKGIVATE